jgi:glutamate-1-semialdehyde 2,1-aminomutase
VATLGLPDSPGVLPEVAQNTITVPFNDAEALGRVFDEAGDQIAAVIIEPVVGNMGCVPPEEGYLQAVRRITERHGAVLIFDEVMTGFRVARGGAQQLYGVKADMTTLGKIIGGGLPVGAFGGRREIMEVVAPVGPVYQAGTLSGNPLAVTAGLTTLRLLKAPAVYEGLERASARLVAGMADAAREAGVSTVSNRVGSMFTTFFTSEPVRDWATANSQRPRSLRPVLPRHAGRGRIPRPVTVRGRLRFHRAYRRNHRTNDRSRAQCIHAGVNE